MLYAGASVKGKSHKKTGLPNQDAFCALKVSGAFVAAVSDGVGSRPLSNIGSHAAVDSVVAASRIIKPNTDGLDIVRLIHAIWRTKITGYSPHSCACTCLFTILFNSGRVFAASLGDGIIALKSGTEQTVLDLAEKDFANSTKAMDTCKLTDWRCVDKQINGKLAIMLATDGVSDDIVEDGLFEFAGFVQNEACKEGLSQRERNNYIVKLLNRWTRPFSYDDKTLLVIRND